MGNQSNRALLSDYLLGQQSSSFGRNYVLNPSGFENVNNISISGSATITRNTATPLTAISDLSVSLPNDTSSGVTWTLNTLDNSLNGQNCMLSFDYTSSSLGSAVQAQVLQGSNISATVTLNPASTPKNVILNTPCGNLGSATTVVITNVTGNSGSSALHVANVNYGKATNIGTVAQAQLLGGVIYTGCTSWNTTSTSFTTSYSGGTGCTCVAFGIASCPSGSAPGMTFSSIAPGELQLHAEGEFSSTGTGKNAYYQFTDGTNAAREISTVGASAVPGVHQSIEYATPQSSVTLQLQTKVDSGGTAYIENPMVFSAYYFPTQSQLALNPNVTPANWSGSGSISGTTNNDSAPTDLDDFGSASGSLTQTSAQNISCSLLSGSTLGIACTLPSLGQYLVCNTSNLLLSTNVGTNYLIFSDAPNAFGNVAIPLVLASAPNGFSTNTSSCGIYSASSLTPTFYIAGGSNTSNTVTAYITSFSIVSLNTPISAPVFVGSVTSSGGGQYHVESITFGGSSGTFTSPVACTSSSCTIIGQTGAWVSSVARNSTGNYTLNISAGEFSSAPNCSVTAWGTLSQFGSMLSSSSTAVSVNNMYSGNQADEQMTVTCMGPH